MLVISEINKNGKLPAMAIEGENALVVVRLMEHLKSTKACVAMENSKPLMLIGEIH